MPCWLCKKGAIQVNAVYDVDDKLVTNNNQQNQYNEMCCPDSQQCLMFIFDFWEEADYLYLCTVVEVIVLPPFFQNSNGMSSAQLMSINALMALQEGRHSGQCCMRVR